MCNTTATAAGRASVFHFVVTSMILTMIVLPSRMQNSADQYDNWNNDGTELIELWGDHETFLKLHCQSIRSQMVVIAAFFTLLGSDTEIYYAEHNIRHCVNKRCSGKNVCSFILARDCPNATIWKNGTIYVQYACIQEKEIIKTCSANVTVYVNQEGFIQTPGYPRYYVGGRDCQWTLRASKQSTQIQLQFMDIALRGVGPLEKKCQDWLIVKEHGLDMLATCGDLTQDTVIRSTGPEVNISLTTTSVNLFPKRGLFIHYQGIGGEEATQHQANVDCDGAPPRGAHLVMHNNTHNHYRCTEGFVFTGTGSRDLIISCRYHYLATTTDAHCVFNMTELPIIVDGNISNETGDEYSDIIGPSILLALLLIGNAFIIGFIYIKKKRFLLNGAQDDWVAVPMKRQSDQYE